MKKIASNRNYIKKADWGEPATDPGIASERELPTSFIMELKQLTSDQIKALGDLLMEGGPVDAGGTASATEVDAGQQAYQQAKEKHDLLEYINYPIGRIDASDGFNMKNKLIKIANHLDNKGYHREANYLDILIRDM